MFFNDDDYTDLAMQRQRNIFSLTELNDFISQSVSNYYGLSNKNDTLDTYLPLEVGDINCFLNKEQTTETICPVEVDASYLPGGTNGFSLLYILTDKNLSIFTDDNLPELKKFIMQTTTFSINYKIKVDYR